MSGVDGDARRIIDVVSRIEAVSGWKMMVSDVLGEETFFIRRKLDMKRRKDVRRIDLTLYRDFAENGETYRGSVRTTIHPTAGGSEIRDVVERGLFSAGFVRNAPYPLVSPSNGGEESRIPDRNEWRGKASASGSMARLVDAVYREDGVREGGINSLELFLNRERVRILNSEGVDVSYARNDCLMELITDWSGDGEAVELYSQIAFSDFDSPRPAAETARLLRLTRDRAGAVPLSFGGKTSVLITENAVAELLRYFVFQTSAQAVFQRISSVRVGRPLQGESVRGDAITLFLDPSLADSPGSVPYDEDGLALKRVEILRDGSVRRLWGSLRFCHYLGLEPTGHSGCFAVEPGTTSAADLRAEAVLEVAGFSDFFCSPVTGDFGGEIRLAYHRDGAKRIAVTGGSIGGRIRDVRGNLRLSRETTRASGYGGPQCILLKDVSVSGGAT